VNELKSFAVLQARVYEFLEQQDETTLQAIVNGTEQLMVARSDNAGARASTTGDDKRDASLSEESKALVHTLQVALDIVRMTSQQERRDYLAKTKLPADKGLRNVAKYLGVPRYSSIRKPDLLNRLISYDLGPSEVPADSGPKPEQKVTAGETQRSAKAVAAPNADAAAIAARLRETETEEEGAAYLRNQHLDKEGLLAVAAQLGLSRVDNLRQADLEKRVLKQAIGARRKFAGLRKW
jgi:hypothetical protein